MSVKTVSFAAALSALILLGAVLVYRVLDASRPDDRAAAALAERLDRIEKSLARRVAALEARPDRKVAAAAPAASDSPAVDESGDTEDGAEEMPDESFEGLAGQLDVLEERVSALEADPIARGYAFVGSSSEELRRQGIAQLRRIARVDPEARDAIRKLLEDASPRVRAEAIAALADVGDKDSIPRVMDLLADADPAVRRRSANALGELEAQGAVAALGEQLGADADARVREEAADVLGRLKGKAAAQSLIKALGDAESDVRGEAIASLGEAGAQEALPALRSMYEKDPGEHRLRLLLAMKALGDDAPFRDEIARLTRAAVGDPDAAVRQRSVAGLARLARDASRETFQQALQDPSPAVRREAERALR